MAPEETIYNTAIADGLPRKLALLLVAQARHETGNFTSAIFRTGNNAFGYSYVAGAKWQLDEPGRVADNGQASAKYLNVVNSTHEITDWIKRRIASGIFPGMALITTPEVYAVLLKKANYFTDSVSNYVEGLKRWFTDNIGVAVTGSGIFFLILLFVFLSGKKRK